MNIREELLEHYSLPHIKRIAKYACSSESRFAELMACFLAPEYRLSQRAAWAVSHAAKNKVQLILPYTQTFVDQLERKDVHNAVIRNSLRVLQEMEIPENLNGKVMNACFGFVENPAAPIAFKAFSLTILQNLSKHYPEIKSELKLIIEDKLDHESPAFISRARKILKEK